MTPPIRFLALVAGCWTLARIAAFLPLAETRAVVSPATPVAFARVEAEPIGTASARTDHLIVPRVVQASSDQADMAFRVETAPFRFMSPRSSDAAVPGRVPPRLRSDGGVRTEAIEDAERETRLATRTAGASASAPSPSTGSAPAAMIASEARSDVPLALPMDRLPEVRSASRLSGDAWLLARRGDGADAIAPGGALLGGSQAGARLLYRLADDAGAPSLSARVSAPLRRNGAEAALGVEWQPARGVPMRLLAERRQRIGVEGRSAFALLGYGGVSDRPVGAGLRLDAYAQAGVVGIRSRDAFADGAATLVRPVAGGLALGVGAWGGAQPGAGRLDVGPRLTTDIGAAGGRARVSLDWRFRIAGNAAPASGPSLTIGAGF